MTAPGTSVPIDPDTAQSASFGGWATAAVSVAMFKANQSTLDKITSGFSVTDTAANVAGSQQLLQSDVHITSITAKDDTTTAVETFNIQASPTPARSIPMTRRATCCRPAMAA